MSKRDRLGSEGGKLRSNAHLRGAIPGTLPCERVDKPHGEFFHTNWTGTGGRVASSTYTV